MPVKKRKMDNRQKVREQYDNYGRFYKKSQPKVLKKLEQQLFQEPDKEFKRNTYDKYQRKYEPVGGVNASNFAPNSTNNNKNRSNNIDNGNIKNNKTIKNNQ